METIEEAQYFASRLDRREISRDVFAAAITRLMIEGVGGQRAAVWMIGSSEGEPALRCLASHAQSGPGGLIKSIGTRVDFLRALRRDGSICAIDASTHPATSALYESTLIHVDAQSLLAVAFSVNGELHGAFTCASIGTSIHWTVHQLATLKRLVARVSPALARAELPPSRQDRSDVYSHAAAMPLWIDAGGAPGRYASLG